jgi:tRNA G18 (ribose-2'-O)-methylase SpoU
MLLYLQGFTLFYKRISSKALQARHQRYFLSTRIERINIHVSSWSTVLPPRRRSLCMMSVDDYDQKRETIKAKQEQAEGRDLVYSNKNMRNVITSTQSLSAKKVHSLLLHRKKREKEREVVVEGPRMVFDLYRNPRTRKYLRKVLIEIDKFRKYAKVFQRLYEENPKDGSNGFIQGLISFYPTHKEIFRVCCTDTVTHQGMVAICKMPDPIEPRFNVNATNTEEHRMYLVCDAVQDPGNMGTLIRSAVACGVSAIYLLPNACDVWNPKAIRAAMGATFAVPIIPTDSWSDCYAQLQLVGCTPSSIYAATMLNDPGAEEQFDFENLEHRTRTEQVNGHISGPTPSKAYYDVDWIGSTSSLSESEAPAAASALIIGSEGNGLTPPLRSAIQDQEVQTVFVPMMNRDSTEPASVVESLNAAVCGSIILFEYLRQKQQLQPKAIA